MQVEQRLTLAGYKVTSSAPHGSAVNEIIRSATDNDRVVMATHGRGGIAQRFVGSGREEVVRRSRVPVLIVRTGQQISVAQHNKLLVKVGIGQ